MIPIQLGAGTFCTWQPVPAAVKNSWKAEAPSRAVNVITAVSTGASLLCMNKIWTVPLPWGFMWCIAPKCTAAHSPGTQQNYFTFLCFLKPIYMNLQCLSIQLLNLRYIDVLIREGQLTIHSSTATWVPELQQEKRRWHQKGEFLPFQVLLWHVK